MKRNPLNAIDFYKSDHKNQYPEGTTEVYSNFTPRSDKHANVIRNEFDGKVVFFGLQYFIKEFLMEEWRDNFFMQDKEKVVSAYKRRMDTALGKDAIDVSHIAALHDLGYLPVKIKAIPEGTRVPIGVPVLTIVNTDPEFFWITNYLETITSCYLWKAITSATTAFEYKKLLSFYALQTGADEEFVQFQAHDFSFRGMSSPMDAALSGAAHLTSFWGTDSVPAIDLLEEYYGADAEQEPIGFSVPATEHSVVCMGTQEGELDTFKRLINETYPSGIVSLVSDTWDFWKVITEFTVELKDDILARDGKVVIRPDSGDPVKIICGAAYPLGCIDRGHLYEAHNNGYEFIKNKGKYYKLDVEHTHNIGVYVTLGEQVPATPELKGAVECLWDVFGGEVNLMGNKMLDSHIGLIYGDSITLERAKDILEILDIKGFASSNIVFGVGSFTYQYNTRDTFGFAMKATSGVVNGERRDIFKNPKTDDGTKKSAKGLLRVERVDGELTLFDQQTEEEEKKGALQCVFYNGVLKNESSLQEVRDRINCELNKFLKEIRSYVGR